MENQQLQWVQKNRQRRSTARPVGELVEKVINSSRVSGSPWRRRLIAVLEAHGGPELLEQVRIIDVRNGELILQVVEPAVRYQLRLVFEQRLLDAIQSELPEAGIHTVRFTAGTQG